MLWYLLLYSSANFKVCGMKKVLDRFFKQVDVIHAIHEHYFRFMQTYVFENCMHSISVYIVLEQATAFEKGKLWQVEPGIIPRMIVSR